MKVKTLLERLKEVDENWEIIFYSCDNFKFITEVIAPVKYICINTNEEG